MATPVLSPEEELQRRRRRNSIALGLVLAALVVIFYVLTIVKVGPGVITQLRCSCSRQAWLAQPTPPCRSISCSVS
jgi:hypothetical protein